MSSSRADLRLEMVNIFYLDGFRHFTDSFPDKVMAEYVLIMLINKKSPGTCLLVIYIISDGDYDFSALPLTI